MTSRLLILSVFAAAIATPSCGGTSRDSVSRATPSNGGISGADAAVSSGGSAGGVTNGTGGSPAAGGRFSGGSGGIMHGNGGAGGMRPGMGGSGGHPSSGGTATDAGVPDASPPPSDAGCEDYARLYVVSWGYNGGLVAYQDTSSLNTPRVYTHMRDHFMNAMPETCKTEVAGCPSTLIAEINAGFQSTAVKDALKAHTVFGVDSRPVDGQVFRISVGMDFLDVGSPCSAGSSGCVAIPAAVAALVDALRALDAQELAKKACTDVFGMVP